MSKCYIVCFGAVLLISTNVYADQRQLLEDLKRQQDNYPQQYEQRDKELQQQFYEIKRVWRGIRNYKGGYAPKHSNGVK